MEKQQLTIKISAETYYQLKTDVGKGNIGEFIENLVDRELGNKEREYREFYSNPKNLKEAKQWEKASIESRAKIEKKKAK